MAQIAYAAPETEETEVVPEKVKITLNKTRQEGKQKNNMWNLSMSMNDSWGFNGTVTSLEVFSIRLPLIIWMLIGYEVVKS